MYDLIKQSYSWTILSYIHTEIISIQGPQSELNTLLRENTAFKLRAGQSQAATSMLEDLRRYVINPLSTYYRPIQFQECGLRHTWGGGGGGFQEQTKDDAMTQAYTCS